MTLALENAALVLGGRRVVAPLDGRWSLGRVHAILGPNGAGKSSLLSLLSGQRRPTTGSASGFGRPLPVHGAAGLARWRAVMPQDAQVTFDYLVSEVVAMGRFAHRLSPSRRESDIVPQALEAVDALHLADRVYNALSGGERARVQLARALAQIWEPVAGLEGRWLLLDEPTAALDLAHQHAVMACARRWAREQGVGVVAVLHDLNLALRYADETLVLEAGRCRATGPTRDVLQPALISDVWGVRCQAEPAADGQLQYLFMPAEPPARDVARRPAQ